MQTSPEKIIIRPSETADYLVYGLLCLTWGLLIGFSWAHNEFYLPNRRELAVIEATNELLSANSDYQDRDWETQKTVN